LDVGVLVDEFDKSVEAIEAASDAAGNDLDNGVVWVSLFHLLIQDFEGNPDDPNDSKDEGAERKRSKIVPDGPPKSSGDGKRSSGLACGSKVPSADAANKDVGEHGLQELADPEECENVHVGHIFLFLAENDALHLGASLWLSNFSGTEKVSEVVKGEQDPGQSNNSGNEWHDEELQVSDNDNGGSLEDSNRHFDCLPEAADGDEVEEGQSIDAISSDKKRFTSLFLSVSCCTSFWRGVGSVLLVVVVLHSVGQSKDGAASSDDGYPNDQWGEPVDEDGVKEGAYDTGENGVPESTSTFIDI